MIVSAMVKNKSIVIIIPITKLEIVLKPIKVAIDSKMKGKTATRKIIIDEKYHNNEYLIGILPFLSTNVVTIIKITEKSINTILNVNDIICTSLCQPL